MAGEMITGVVWLLTIMEDVGMALMLSLAWGTWRQVRTGRMAWTPSRERGCLISAVFCAACVPLSVWVFLVGPSADQVGQPVATALTAWYFGRAWWKLHKDGPNNGRRRRRAKYAIKRLGDRLVPASIPTPAPQ